MLDGRRFRVEPTPCNHTFASASSPSQLYLAMESSCQSASVPADTPRCEANFRHSRGRRVVGWISLDITGVNLWLAHVSRLGRSSTQPPLEHHQSGAQSPEG